MYNLLSATGDAVINGNGNDFGQGAGVSGVAVALVFGILALIIGITYLANLLINLKKKDITAEEETESVTASTPAPVQKTVELDSEEAEVAMLIASIDYRQETKQDIKVISVKEIK